MKKFISLTGGLALFVLAASTAHAAALIDLSLGSTVNYGVNVSEDTNSKTSVSEDNKTLKSDTSVEVRPRVATSTNSNLHNNSETLSDEDEVFVSGDSRDRGALEAQSKADDNALNNANSNSALKFKASEVTSIDDLRAFASSTVRNDNNVDELRFKSDQVELGYKEQGKFLGLFKMPYRVHVIAHTDGSVDVKYPWYAFLFSPDRQTIKQEIDTAVSAIVGNTASTTGQVTLSASTAARIAEAIRNILVANFGTNTSLTATTTSR